MILDSILGGVWGEGKSPGETKEIYHRIYQFYHRVVDLAEANHKTAAALEEENARLEKENEEIKEFCQELLSSMADLELECSHFQQKARAVVLNQIPHKEII